MKRNLARTTMKRILSAFLAFAVLAALTIVATTSKYTVHRVYAQSGCSLATLTGNYAFSQPGFTPKNAMGIPLPIAVVGVSTFDGAGNVSATFTDMSPGKPTYIAVQGTGAGTYTVNSDCTGSASFTSGSAAGETLNMVIIGGGTEVFGINTTPFVIATADFKKQ
jgi:hypothetical protein